MDFKYQSIDRYAAYCRVTNALDGGYAECSREKAFDEHSRLQNGVLQHVDLSRFSLTRTSWTSFQGIQDFHVGIGLQSYKFSGFPPQFADHEIVFSYQAINGSVLRRQQDPTTNIQAFIDDTFSYAYSAENSHLGVDGGSLVDFSFGPPRWVRPGEKPVFDAASAKLEVGDANPGSAAVALPFLDRPTIGYYFETSFGHDT